jgi:hypothetical protein
MAHGEVLQMSVSVKLLRMGFIHPTVFLTVCIGRYVHRLSLGFLKYILCVCEPLIRGRHYMRIRPRHLKSQKNYLLIIYTPTLNKSL